MIAQQRCRFRKYGDRLASGCCLGAIISETSDRPRNRTNLSQPQKPSKEYCEGYTCGYSTWKEVRKLPPEGLIEPLPVVGRMREYASNQGAMVMIKPSAPYKFQFGTKNIR
jgi:hypothetical protein